MRKFLACCAVAFVAGCGASQPQDPILVDGSRLAFTAAAKEVLPTRGNAHLHPVSVRVSLVDEYGNETSAPVVTLSWAESDLSQINWTGFSDTQLANLANVRIDGRHGVIAFAEWCDAYSALTPRLCRQERTRAEEDWARRLAQSAG